ncbi:WD repeat-containing protein 70-like [Planoprotostelium fungivorum]|uniref:WD repeat-containing protein 70-like n=1 Tax=Planoprotostelium fungivorum TaxID=1890364 RepID=A0A2P6MVW0_9EUKA|nr:WD repeat-containing protein 70-like [Planoprotostelium fungivorum]
MSDDEAELRALRQSKQYQAVGRTKADQPTETEPEPQRFVADKLSNADEEPELPTSFGAKTITSKYDFTKDVKKKIGPSRPQASARSDDSEMIGPPRPPPPEEGQEDDLAEGEQLTAEDSNYYKIPYSHEAILKGHSKMVSVVCLDPSGSRLLSGGYDTNLKMWDFAGMDRGLRSFRNVVPSEGNNIRALEFTHTGDAFLCATTSWQAKLYNRDGVEEGECIKGDMYLMDQVNTKGHTSTITKAAWRPKDKTNFVTSSMDATIRIWDVETIKRKQRQVIKLKGDNGKKVGGSTLHCSPDGSHIAVACQDGSVQLFTWKTNSRPTLTLKEAHAAGNDITSVKFCGDSVTLATRNSKTPLAVFDDLPNFGELECTWSPDDNLIMTGTSVKKGNGTGLLVFYDRKTLSRVKQIGISQGASVASILWHPKINQLVVGTSESQVHVLYDPTLSTKGALLSVVKAPRAVDPNDFEPARPIITPHALPMYAETLSQKRKDARSSRDPRKTAKLAEGPLKPRASTSIMPALFATFIKKNTQREEDPRDALLAHAADADENPMFFGAYKETQPEKVFDYTPETEQRIAKPKQT